jgi:hypothetical protein
MILKIIFTNTINNFKKDKNVFASIDLKNIQNYKKN